MKCCIVIWRGGGARARCKHWCKALHLISSLGHLQCGDVKRDTFCVLFSLFRLSRAGREASGWLFGSRCTQHGHLFGCQVASSFYPALLGAAHSRLNRSTRRVYGRLYEWAGGREKVPACEGFPTGETVARRAFWPPFVSVSGIYEGAVSVFRSLYCNTYAFFK
jgi:hypothetical protein